MKTRLLPSTFNWQTVELMLTALLVVLLILCDLAVFFYPVPPPTSVPVQETQAAPKIPNDQFDSLLESIILFRIQS